MIAALCLVIIIVVFYEIRRVLRQGIDHAAAELVFRPLSPRLETKLYLVWKKFQPLTPIAERFLEEIKRTFG